MSQSSAPEYCRIYQFKLTRRNCTLPIFSAIPILGKATVAFEVAGLELKGEFLVSNATDELIFGADWLKKFDCVWNFATDSLTILATSEPRSIPLISVIRRNKRMIMRKQFDEFMLSLT